MGAVGVILAAMATHEADTARLAPASMMLLFHACAVLGTVALAERGLIHFRIGLMGACGFAFAASLFSSDLVTRHVTGERLFPFAAPTGGTLLIASWLVLTLAALWPRRG
ncbi:DUF423 domain-containing protein [Bradyrhizobium sp. STM 3557]|uniref:DUF423 domain-containing protein n=1 Tax=Bradyrhizobium sp. STM 3557 TaxID=578920 RepID=UPI00388E08A6